MSLYPYQSMVPYDRSYKRSQPVVDWLTKRLKQISYKPGWEFKPDIGWSLEEDTPTYIIVVRAPIICVDTGEHTHFVAREQLKERQMVEALGDDNAFADVIRKLVRRVELHEVDEWLKLKDKRPFDPHTPEQRAFSLTMNQKSSQYQQELKRARDAAYRQMVTTPFKFSVDA